MKNGDNYDINYYLKDHLGNVRTVLKEDGTVLQETEYYPFGLAVYKNGNDAQNKYLYNGKEKQPETAWLDYGARMYDPTIGRFFTVDRFSEKCYSVSPYSYAANNSINLIDINGDSLWISFAGNNILYKNGSLFNKDGTSYSGKGVKTDKTGNVVGYKGFLGKVMSALNAIGGTSEGSALLGELQTSKNNFNIEQSADNKFLVDNSQRIAGFANQLKTDPQYSVQLKNTPVSALQGGAGGTIQWDPSGANVWTLGGQNNTPASNLGHELFHGRDANRGLLDGRVYQGVKYDEWQATYKENQLRLQMGLPLREYYRSQSNSGVLGPLAPRMLDQNNSPIRPSWVPVNY